jgi:hypothetical protein
VKERASSGMFVYFRTSEILCKSSSVIFAIALGVLVDHLLCVSSERYPCQLISHNTTYNIIYLESKL